MNITEIIRRVEQKSAVTDELTRQQQRRQELTRAYDDVIAKYSALIERVDTDFRAFENAQHALVNEREYATNKQNESLMQTRRNEENEVYTRFEEKSQLSADKLQQLREEKSQQNNELLRIAHEAPYKEEHAKADEELNKLNTRAQELKMSIQQLSTQAVSLRQEAGMKLRELELAQAQPLANAQKEKQEIEEQIARLESLIERRKGSLAEWLDRNKPAWKDTIGKIADEEKILYRNDLAPQVTNQGEASLYGVQIDLTALERNFRTPEELKAELAIYQGALSQCVKRINMLHQELAEQTEALKKQYNKRLREITDRQRLQESEQLQLPAFIKNAMAQSASWQKKTDDWREQRMVEIRMKQNDTAHRLALCEEEIKKLKADRAHRLKVCEKSYKEKKLRLEQELNNYRNSIETEIKLHKQQSLERRKELEASQQAELSGKGADTAAIGKYDARILQIQKELAYIEKHFPDTIRYQKDKEELFDREPQLRSRKKMLEDESEIYQKRDDGLDANNGQLKKLKGREKRAYFRQYYLGTVAVVIVVAILAVLFFKNAVQKKPHCVLYIAIEDDVLDEDKVADFEKAVEKYLNIDTKNEYVKVDNGTSDQEIQTYIYSGVVDVIIASEDTYKRWANEGCMADPSSSDTVSFYKDYDKNKKYFAKYVSGEELRKSKQSAEKLKSSEGKTYNFGLYLSDSKKYKETLGGLLKKPVAGITATSKNTEEAKQFIKWMME